MFRRLASATLILLVTTVAYGGKYNPTLKIGDVAPTWPELPGVDDKQHSFDELKDKDVVVVVFTCNSCPYAVDCEERLVALHDKYGQQNVAIVAINVNKIEEDLLPAMKVRAQEKGFPFPYLFDETQQIARDFGAGYTPEFFVLNRDRKVSYMGSLESQDKSKHYVELAVDAVLTNSVPEVTESVPIGCRIRFERKRRTRKRE